MVPDIPFIQARFDRFNELIFSGKLPKIPVALSNAASYVGLCTFKTRRRLFGRTEHYDFKLRFSKRFDLPENEVEDTVIHEMIHYYIRLNNIKDTSAHGKVFRQMMEQINSTYGRHITVSHRTTKEQREAVLDKRPKLRYIAIVTFKDGRQGIKLLPHDERKVAAYHRVLMRSRQVSAIDYFEESDPWFNRFPTSSAFNVIMAPMEEVKEHLTASGPSQTHIRP